MKKLGPNDRCACNSGKKVKKCCIVSFVYTPDEIIERKKKKENLARWLEEDDSAAKENLIAFESQLKQWETNHTKEKIPLTGEPFDRKTVGVKRMIRRYDEPEQWPMTHTNIGLTSLKLAMAAVGTPWKNPSRK